MPEDRNAPRETNTVEEGPAQEWDHRNPLLNAGGLLLAGTVFILGNVRILVRVCAAPPGQAVDWAELWTTAGLMAGLMGLAGVVGNWSWRKLKAVFNPAPTEGRVPREDPAAGGTHQH